jgi:hypothetical protein
MTTHIDGMVDQGRSPNISHCRILAAWGSGCRSCSSACSNDSGRPPTAPDPLSNRPEPTDTDGTDRDGCPELTSGWSQSMRTRTTMTRTPLKSESDSSRPPSGPATVDPLRKLPGAKRSERVPKQLDFASVQEV